MITLFHDSGAAAQFESFPSRVVVFLLQDDRYRRDGDGRFDSDRDERLRRSHGRNDRISEKSEKGQDRRSGRSRFLILHYLPIIEWCINDF